MISPIDKLLSLPPYGLSPFEKQRVFLPAVQAALMHHYQRCQPFKIWCDKQKFNPNAPITELASIPFMPVNVFKTMTLRSVPAREIVRVLTSSATSSQIPSRVELDNVTRERQLRCLTAVLADLLGTTRRPFIVLDLPPTDQIKTDLELSARVAGLRGYLIASSETYYALKNDNGNPALDLEYLIKTVRTLSQAETPFCILGYTYMLYQYVLRPLRERGVNIRLPETTRLLHFGGWKKLGDLAVSKEALNALASSVFDLPAGSIRDIYGFTEQLGVIYPDDANGVKRAPVYSEVLVRDPVSLEVLPDGQAGLLEFITPLPNSYPGVALLTDDMGSVIDRRSGSNDQGGRRFEIIGRAKDAEVRGCGDTLAEQIYEVRS